MPQPDPNAPPESVILSKFDGLKNTLNPERLTARDLVRAMNVDLDDDGQLSRRRGFQLKVSGNAHSPFATDRNTVIVVLNGVLGFLNPNYSFTSFGWPIATNPSSGEPPLAYAQIDNSVYFTSPTDQGVVSLTTGTVSAWVGSPPEIFLSPVVSPTILLPAIAGRQLGPPPNASTLAYFNGRLHMGVGRYLWSTEPWLYDYVDVTRNYLPFEGDITMIGVVGDGMYVGTAEGVYFLTGGEYPYKKVRVMDSSVIPGSMVLIPGELGNPPQIPPGSDTTLQVAVCFMTDNGFCVASDGGQTYNLTENKVFFPAMTSASAMYRRQDGMNQYVAALQHGGDPMNNARIGDYVDATIIRGAARGAWVIVPPDTAQITDTLVPIWSTAGFVSGVTWEASDSVGIHDVLATTWSGPTASATRVTEDGQTRVTEDNQTRVSQ